MLKKKYSESSADIGPFLQSAYYCGLHSFIWLLRDFSSFPLLSPFCLAGSDCSISAYNVEEIDA